MNCDRKHVCAKPDTGRPSCRQSAASRSLPAGLRRGPQTPRAALQTLPGLGLPASRRPEGLRLEDAAAAREERPGVLGSQARGPGTGPRYRWLSLPSPRHTGKTKHLPAPPTAGDPTGRPHLCSSPLALRDRHPVAGPALRPAPAEPLWPLAAPASSAGRPEATLAARPEHAGLALPVTRRVGVPAVSSLGEARLAPFLSRSSAEHFKAPGEAKSPSGPRHEADAVTPRSRGKAGARGGKGVRPGPRPGAPRSTPLSVRPPQSRLWPTHRPSAQQGSTSGLGPLGPARPGSLSPAGSGPAEHTAPGRAVGPPASPPSSEDTLLRGPGQRRPFAHSPLAGLPGPRTGHVPQSHIHLPGDTYPIRGLSVPERSRGTATPPGVTLLPRELAAGACA